MSGAHHAHKMPADDADDDDVFYFVMSKSVLLTLVKREL